MSYTHPDRALFYDDEEISFHGLSDPVRERAVQAGTMGSPSEYRGHFQALHAGFVHTARRGAWLDFTTRTAPGARQAIGCCRAFLRARGRRWQTGQNTVARCCTSTRRRVDAHRVQGWPSLP